jgi:hypothetical protein
MSLEFERLTPFCGAGDRIIRTGTRRPIGEEPRIGIAGLDQGDDIVQGIC